MSEEIKEVKIAEPKQKIQVDLEVDTSIKDLGINPYASRDWFKWYKGTSGRRSYK